VLREQAATAEEPLLGSEMPMPEAPTPSSASLPPAIDRQAMVRQLGGIDAGTIDMLRMFVKMTRPTLLEKIDAAFTAGDTKKLKEVGHSLKGSARSACCPHLGDLCAALQEAAEKGHPVTAEMITAIKAEFERVAAEVEVLKV